MKTDYQKQAEQFLADTKTELEILKAIPQKKPLWHKEGEKHGINYSITLKNNKHSYTFDFWGSIADAEKIYNGNYTNTKPKAYEILACIYPYYGTFKDFCDDFGYSDDSILAEKTYYVVLEQTKELNKLFTEQELEKLQEIQ